ncbi:DUF7695 domain-containing protein, partial [Halolactibacillus alkaliphilus]
MMKPLTNKIQCKKCNDIIESKHRNDLVYCQCGAIYVDGGHEYQRYVWSVGIIEGLIDFIYSKYKSSRIKKENVNTSFLFLLC